MFVVTGALVLSVILIIPAAFTLLITLYLLLNNLMDFFFSWALGQALSKTLTVDELFYLREQFALLEPSKNGTISLENIKAVGFVSIYFYLRY